MTRTLNQSLRMLTGAEPGRLRLGSAAIRRTALLVALTVAVVLVLARVTDLAQFRASASQLISEPGLLAAFLVTYTAAFWLRAIAWRQLFAPAPGTLPLFGILQAALFANHLLPLKAGEIVRPYLLTRHGVGAATATTTTVVARLLDFVVLLFLAGLLLPLTAGSLWSAVRILALPTVILGAAGIALVWLRTSFLTTALPERMTRLIRTAGDSLRTITPARVTRAALWTLPSWVLEGAVVIIAARTMGIDLAVPVAVAVTAVTILFQIVHLTPGGLGVYEASMAGALALHGLPLEQGITLAVIAHGMKFAYALVIGGLCTALAARAVARGSGGRDSSYPYAMADVEAGAIAPTAGPVSPTADGRLTKPERVARP